MTRQEAIRARLRLDRQRTLRDGLLVFAAKQEAAAFQLAQDIGDRLLEHVRTEYVRPITGKGFTDRTGHLRASIRAYVNLDEHRVVMRLVAGMYYARIVETIKDGTYAYLGPTIQDLTPEIRVMVRERMSALAVDKAAATADLAMMSVQNQSREGLP